MRVRISETKQRPDQDVPWISYAVLPSFLANGKVLSYGMPLLA